MNEKKNKEKKKTQRMERRTEVDKQKRKSFGRTQSQSYKHNTYIGEHKIYSERELRWIVVVVRGFAFTTNGTRAGIDGE